MTASRGRPRRPGPEHGPSGLCWPRRVAGPPGRAGGGRALGPVGQWAEVRTRKQAHRVRPGGTVCRRNEGHPEGLRLPLVWGPRQRPGDSCDSGGAGKPEKRGAAARTPELAGGGREPAATAELLGWKPGAQGSGHRLLDAAPSWIPTKKTSFSGPEVFPGDDTFLPSSPEICRRFQSLSSNVQTQTTVQWCEGDWGWPVAPRLVESVESGPSGGAKPPAQPWGC